MTFFLDTDICIFSLRGMYPSIAQAFRSRSPGQIKVPAIVAAELWLGARKSRSPATALKAVKAFLEPLQIVPFDAQAAEAYAVIREDLEEKGSAIGPNDLIIAATAFAGGATLVTHNVKEFGRVTGLKVQDWTK